MSDEKKAFLMCVLALLLGSIIAVSSGCAVGAGARIDGHGAAAAGGLEIAP